MSSKALVFRAKLDLKVPATIEAIVQASPCHLAEINSALSNDSLRTSIEYSA